MQMQLSQYGANAQTSGLNHAQAFSMQMNAKMFSILTDKLYTNKEGAVIRELSSNAKDAHVAAGCPDKPFYLKLPSWLDKTFMIRDYGTGIHPDKFCEVYTNLGYSTKENENESLGAYGLGSKTPFALTDTYTIRNFYNGKVYTYTAYKDAGMPTVSLIGSMDTEDPNGLEISLSYDLQYTGAFIDATREQLRYFKVKPIVDSDEDFEWLEVPDLSKGYSIRDSFNLYATIVMGGVPYELKYSDIVNHDFYDVIRRTNLILKVDIGDVDVTPSRENVEITEKTLNTLRKRISEIKENYGKDIVDSITNAKTVADLMTIQHECSINLLRNSDILQKVVLVNIKGFKKTATLENVLRKAFVFYHDAEFCLARDTQRNYGNATRLSNSFIPRYSNLFTFSMEDHKRLIVNDLAINYSKHIKQNVDKLNSNHDMILIGAREKGEKIDVISKRVTDKLDELGFKYVLLSEILPAIEKTKKGTARAPKPNQVFQYTHEIKRGRKPIDISSTLNDSALPAEGYYVPLKGWVTTVDQNILAFAAHLGYKIYGLRKHAMKEVSKSNLKPFEDEILIKVLRVDEANKLRIARAKRKVSMYADMIDWINSKVYQYNYRENFDYLNNIKGSENLIAVIDRMFKYLMQKYDIEQKYKVLDDESPSREIKVVISKESKEMAAKTKQYGLSVFRISSCGSWLPSYARNDVATQILKLAGEAK